MVHGFEYNACKCVDNIYQMHWIKNAPESPHFQYSVSISYYHEILNFVPPIEISITYLSSFLCLFFFYDSNPFFMYLFFCMNQKSIACERSIFIWNFFPLNSCNAYTFILLWTNKFSIFFFSHFCSFFGYPMQVSYFQNQRKILNLFLLKNVHRLFSR